MSQILVVVAAVEVENVSVPKLKSVRVVKETTPLVYESGALNVVVAVHVGMPLTRARTVPLVVEAILAKVPTALAYSMFPGV